MTPISTNDERAVPAGLRVERSGGDAMRLELAYAWPARAALACGRSALIVLVASLLILLWRRVHALFLFFGFPLLLAGPAATQLVLGRDWLTLPGSGLLATARELGRSEIASLCVRRGGLWQGFGLELAATLRSGEEITLLPNLTREQASYVLELTRRWLV